MYWGWTRVMGRGGALACSATGVHFITQKIFFTFLTVAVGDAAGAVVAAAGLARLATPVLPVVSDRLLQQEVLLHPALHQCRVVVAL